MIQRYFFILPSISAVLMMAFYALARMFSRCFQLLKKKEIFILILFALLNTLIAFAITYVTDDPFLTYWIFSFMFLAFGIVNFMLVHDKFKPNLDENRFVVIVGEVFFVIAMVLFIGIIMSLLEYYFRNKLFLFYPILISTVFFIVPFLFYYTYDFAIGIPPSIFNIWEYPVLKRRYDPPASNGREKTYMITFFIPKKLFHEKTKFISNAPESFLLGDLFYHFINEYNDDISETTIEIVDENEKPIVWWFRLKRKWYQLNVILDPYKPVRDNFIKEDSIIICEQLTEKP